MEVYEDEEETICFVVVVTGLATESEELGNETELRFSSGLCSIKEALLI